MATAPAADQLALLRLQELDTRLTQLAHRRATLSSVEVAAQADAELSAARDVAAQASAHLGDISRELAKAEADVEVVRARAARNNEKLAAGVGTAKDLVALQSELEMLGRRRGELEDIVLEVMERHEAAGMEADNAAARVGELEERARDAHATVSNDLGEIDTETREVTAAREAAAQVIDAGLLGLYDKTRARGIGAAELRAGRCGGCRLELNTTELSRIREASDQEIIRCEECGCILVRTEHSGL